MPQYIDYHETMPPMPPEVAQAAQEKIKAGQVDEFGVKTISAVMGGGHAWCLSEAPSPDAVCQAHQAMGIPQDNGNVTEVQILS